MTLRVKLGLFIALLGLVASALVGVFAFRATRDQLEATTDAFLLDRAEEIAGGARLGPNARPGRRNDGQAGPFQLPFDADALTQSLLADGTLVDSGTPLPVTDHTLEMAALEPGRIAVENARYDDIVVDGEPFRMISLALPDGGALQVARSTAESDDVTSGLVVRIAAISAGVAVLGALIGALIARQTTRPLRRLADTAGDVAATRDFTTRVEVDRHDEIGQLAAAFREMLDALEESREQQYRLVHDAGHELRTPLTSLRANVAMLERFDRMGDDDRRAVLDAVRSELVELGDLFTELIDLATDQRGEAAVHELVDVGDLVAGAGHRWRRRTDRTITVDVDAAAHVVFVEGDPAMLERAVDNLLSNADKFSDAGAEITVTLTSLATGDGGRGTVRVGVRDRGPGISPAERERIFDRFYRSDRTRSMPGSGLGLAIVAQIVDQHGGTVFVDDPPGGGALIGFELPRAAVETSADRATAAP